MRLDLTPWLIMAAVITAISCAILPTKAHEAITGWHYPFACCSDGDCAHAISATRNPDGSLTVTTKHGTATFPASFEHQPSPDGLIHACFTPSKLYCLYLATGI